jgi:hypothetical protein
MSYARLVRFILPLAVTAIVVELGSQVLNAGMARAPAATMTLAAYGLAWGLILFLTAPLGQAKELGLALVNDRTALVVVRRFVVLLGAALMVGLASLTLTPLGNLVIERLHAIDAGLGAVVRTALFWLIPYPLLKGYALFHAGLLLRVRHTERVSYATLSNLGVSIVAAFGLIFMPWIQTRPILLPILVTYLGILAELAVLLTGVAQHGAPVTARPRPANAPPITLGRVVRFFWPLALIMLVQEVSRPVINLFVARGPDATNALAILAVLYTLGRIPYGWLNEIRNLAPAFRDEVDSRPAIRRFALACGLVSMTMMGVLFWTPLRDVILEQWIGVPPHLAALAVTPLHLFTLFSISVTLRGYYHGIGLAEGRTRAMAPSAPARFVAIVSTLVGLPWLGVTGATLGVAALLAGFTAEAIVVWWGVRGRAWLRRRRQAGTPAPA